MAVFLYNAYWRTWNRVLLESMDREGWSNKALALSRKLPELPKKFKDVSFV